jgi:hypothetical protein
VGWRRFARRAGAHSRIAVALNGKRS